jgi:hypothetical protein
MTGELVVIIAHKTIIYQWLISAVSSNIKAGHQSGEIDEKFPVFNR